LPNEKPKADLINKISRRFAFSEVAAPMRGRDQICRRRPLLIQAIMKG
jgi:hypothetical protein